MPKVREDEIFARLFEPSEEEKAKQKLDKLVVDMVDRWVRPTWRVFDDVELYIVEDKGDGKQSID